MDILKYNIGKLGYFARHVTMYKRNINRENVDSSLDNKCKLRLKTKV